MQANTVKFIAPLFVVEDIEKSRRFYEDILGQQVKYDFGEDIQFEGGFSIHQRKHFQTLLGEESRFPIKLKSNSSELYFDADDLDSLQDQLNEAGVEIIQDVHEESWGQMTMRFYDPDGHIIEIGEPFDRTIPRLYSRGLTVNEICQKTGMSLDYVEQAICQPAANT